MIQTTPLNGAPNGAPNGAARPAQRFEAPRGAPPKPVDGARSGG